MVKDVLEWGEVRNRVDRGGCWGVGEWGVVGGRYDV